MIRVDGIDLLLGFQELATNEIANLGGYRSSKWPEAKHGAKQQTKQYAQCCLPGMLEQGCDDVADENDANAYSDGDWNEHAEGKFVLPLPERFHGSQNGDVLTEDQQEIASGEAWEHHGRSSGRTCEDQKCGSTLIRHGAAGYGFQQRQGCHCDDPGDHAKHGWGVHWPGHGPQEGNASERKADEEAVHRPAVVQDEVLHCSSSQQDGCQCSGGNDREHDEWSTAEAERRASGYGMNESSVYTSGNQHGATGDSGHQIGQAHQDSTQKSTKQRRAGCNPVVEVISGMV